MLSSKQGGILNYDQRERGNPVETCREHALLEIITLDEKLESLSENAAIVDRDVTVSFSMSSSSEDGDGFTPFSSSLSRELAFASHHAMHHLAMMKVIATLPLEKGGVVGLGKVDFPSAFGKAPATVLFEAKEKDRERGG